ncbi:Asp-tRNA(Asn)/Glu-tRNA(Gln) amidotransferase subunit GatC [Gordonia polyisoprenivorans]|uniref:Asp-tRNA(Asn)/Glu-tRNA(Gln) amidotransferase subunit GatC n=1 Tax=Gordonia TaxID=2053 RepID=UPI0009CAE1F4|nr:Asp-tRNA(Asn)/Glu-tRNA(Gln) amidotransferase subunit GatC [Gordonia sp. i37]OPX14538.1 asparaginyl/glutamyl-tRNA amidotransferase subunit C [Gordonia sp. i37]UZF54460.1 Asp-tRNA(Asn)/Glu-tRNA(Gln) amidotransferase subunit GatC [Gordonia polyisoprenivorans]
MAGDSESASTGSVDSGSASTGSAITRDEVAHLARLSRLALSEDELDVYAQQLDSILAHVAQVSEVAADDVPPTAHPAALANVLRPDVAVPGLTTEQALSGAPAVEQDRFAVPQILGEEQ